MTAFTPIAAGSAIKGRYARAGSGAPVIALQQAGAAGPTPFHARLAEQCEVTLVTPDTRDAVTGETLATLRGELGYPTCALFCDADHSKAGLDFALRAGEALSAIAVEAPPAEVEGDYAELATPVLIIESSNAGLGGVGQKLTAALPHSFHIFIYDTPIANPTARPEAAAEVVGDFMARAGGFILKKPQGVLFPEDRGPGINWR